jgi:hypothetical protein
MQVYVEIDTIIAGLVTGTQYFSGDSAVCPPLPRLGELVDVDTTQRKVVSVIHTISFDAAKNPSLNVVVSISNDLPAPPLGLSAEV